MKRKIALIGLLCVLLNGCAAHTQPAQVVATTLPVYEFTAALCQDTDITVCRLVSESVTCLHDYALSVSQVRAVEGAQVVVQSGAGLEDFLSDLLIGKQTIDCSEGVPLLQCHHDHDHDHAHTHETDAHIWLSPANAMVMAENICAGLSKSYPAYAERFSVNLQTLLQKIAAVDAYGKAQLSSLTTREMITFHDGFSYFADAFDLEILHAIEEESGSEASAAELIALISLAKEHKVEAVFTERNGHASAADVICREIDGRSYALDMAMSGESWFSAMYYNIDTVKEALG